jgi:hypothetical protein
MLSHFFPNIFDIIVHVLIKDLNYSYVHATLVSGELPNLRLLAVTGASKILMVAPQLWLMTVVKTLIMIAT